MKESRNRRCPCGSGKKFKHCCERKAGRPSLGSIVVWSLLGFVLVAGGVGAVLGVFTVTEGADGGPPGPGWEWHEEHGHWHQVGGPGTPPPGPAPPGKVWSYEHGHWHDIDDAAPAGAATSSGYSPIVDVPVVAPATALPRQDGGAGGAPPPGPAPPGKVWSPEHGHWHDID
jgi:hypothetical protein